MKLALLTALLVSVGAASAVAQPEAPSPPSLPDVGQQVDSNLFRLRMVDDEKHRPACVDEKKKDEEKRQPQRRTDPNNM